MYDYQTERPHLFTDSGQRLLLKVRDHIAFLIRASGACTIERALDAGVTADSFHALRLYRPPGGEIRVLRDGLRSTSSWVIVPTGGCP